MSLAPQQTKDLTLNLDAQLLWPGIDKPGTYLLWRHASGTDVLLLDRQSISRVDGIHGSILWRTTIPATLPDQSEIFGSQSGLEWPYRARFLEPGPQTAIDARPSVAEESVDLDGDSQPDIVLAGSTQAWVLATSGATGQPLWLVRWANEPTEAGGRSSAVASAVVAPPRCLPDLDGDGVRDLLISYFEQRDFSAAQTSRRVEALSGKSGRVLWQRELPPDGFSLANGVAAPYAMRRFTGDAPGWSHGGGGFLSNLGSYVRHRGSLEWNGSHAYVQDRPQLLPIPAAGNATEPAARASCLRDWRSFAGPGPRHRTTRVGSPVVWCSAQLSGSLAGSGRRRHDGGPAA